MKACLVSAPMTGAGKTTVTLGLISALRRRGVAIQPFKVGPDFIDPGLHEIAAGTLSHNLDGWMIPRRATEQLFARACAGKDLAVVEGVMGLFDGYDGNSAAGSTAEIARWLDIPVILVIDAERLGRSVAAMVKGYRLFDPGLKIAGIILNRVWGTGHYRILADALHDQTILGWLPADSGISIPERHLGLLTANEEGVATRIREIGDFFSDHVDLDNLMSHIPDVAMKATGPVSDLPANPRWRVAMARDKAFSFYYHANRMEFERAGATIVEFSPLTDREVPEADLLYLGGGFPELYRTQLEANTSMRDSVRRFVESGRKCYAECGGLMYLAESIDGCRMVGILPTTIQMTDRPVDFGYCEIETQHASILGPAGTKARGHQFHYSKMLQEPRNPVYSIHRGETACLEGFMLPNGLASYVHLHFLSNPSIARAMLEA